MDSGKIKKTAFLIAGILLVVVFSAFLVNKDMHDPRIFSPVMTFSQEKLELGDVPEGPQVHGEFEFKNTGQNMLDVKNIQPACGCTGIVANEKKQYMPGESGKIEFTFNTEGRVGSVEKQITIETNEAKIPRKTVSFTVNVLPKQ